MNRFLVLFFVLLAAGGCQGTLDADKERTDAAVAGDGAAADGSEPPPDAGDIGLEACGASAFDSEPAVFDGLESTYYVRKGGDDANDGTTPQTAFATISHGVEALAAGDTLTIGPGEYHESVRRESLGSDAADTVIRAAIPGTVVLRGDVPAPELEPHEDFNFIHVGDFDPEIEIQMVNELDTLTPIERTADFRELELKPGFFYQDQEAGKLYISTSDRRPVEEHRYSVSVTRSHGIYITEPVRVVIDGLVATGFTSSTNITHRERTGRTVWGMFLHRATDSVLRRVHAYLNGRGIAFSSPDDHGGHNVIEHAVARGNWSRAGNNQSDLGGISLFNPKQDVVRDSAAFLNGEYGINIRGGGTNGQLESYQSFVRRSLAWGNGATDFKIKTGYSNIHQYESCVAPLGTLSNTTNASHCLLREGRGGLDAFGSDNILLSAEEGLDVETEFADPANHDYRLQATSKFRGAAPDGSDRGPFPYEPEVYYVSPDGDDGDDGLSMGQAFKTIGRAAEALEAGGTLYLAPGTYSEDVALSLSGTADEPIAIRGRGTGAVVLEGAWSFTDSQHVQVERLHFASGVEVQSSQNVAFENSSFSGGEVGLAARTATGLRLVHNLFTGFSGAGVSLEGSERSYLAGNLFDNRDAVGVRVDASNAVVYADYNGYRHATIAWQVGEGGCSLDDARVHFETHSHQVAPELEAVGGRPVVRNTIDVAARGPYARPLGNYRDEKKEPELRVTEEPKVRSVSATTANIEWGVSLPATTHFTWGPTREMTNEVSFEALYAANYSLTGLEPDTTYYFQIQSLSIPNIVDIQLDDVEVDSPVLELTTAPSDPEPTTYYVAPEGDDANSGTSRTEAFASIQQAADVVGVGDTVQIAGGTYQERVLIRATGTPSAPITFRNVPGEKVLIDGAEMLNQAFVVAAKSHLVFDGFFFDRHAFVGSFSTGPDARFDSWRGGRASAFNIYDSQDITISRILSDGRSHNDAPDVTAHDVDNLLISNIVSTNKFGGALYLLHSPNVRIEHSVFMRPLISAFLLRNEADQPSTWEQNIFTDNLKKKADLNIQMMTADRSTDGMLQTNNVYQIRSFPVEEREVFYATMTLPEAESRGIVEDYLVTDPEYAGIVDLIEMGEGPWEFSPDRFCGALDIEFDFAKFFATDPTVVDRGIGLEPEKFTGDGIPN